MNRIYLDHNATSPPRPAARRGLEAGLRHWANPSAGYQEAREALELVRSATEAVHDLVGSRPGDRVLWCGSATEALSTVIAGLGDPKAGPIVTDVIEHQAVLRACRRIARDRGAGTPDGRPAVVTLRPDSQGRILASDFEEEIRWGASLVVIQAANPETGVLQPYREVAALCRSRAIPCVWDAVQLLGRMPIEVRGAEPSALVLSPHKAGALKGVGILWLREGVELRSLYSGGRQQAGQRPGTEPVPAIAAAGSVIRELRGTTDRDAKAMREARDVIERGLVLELGGTIWGAAAKRLPNTTSVDLGVDAHELVRDLDRVGVSVASASACGLGGGVSHVVSAIAGPAEAARTIRISTGPETTIEEAKEALRRIGSVWSPLASRRMATTDSAR